MAILVHVNWYKVAFPVVNPINHVFKFCHLSCVRVSVAGKGDKWNSKKLVTVTSNHHWELNRFHLAYEKTPGSHLRSEGSRRGRVYCVKMRKKMQPTALPVMFSGSSEWQETVSHKFVFLCFCLLLTLSKWMDDWVYVIHCTAPLVLSTYFYISTYFTS